MESRISIGTQGFDRTSIKASDEPWKEDLRKGSVKAVDIWQSLLQTKDLPRVDAKKQRKAIFL